MRDFPLDFKRGLKAIWAAVHGEKPSLEVKERMVLNGSLQHLDPLSEVLRHLTLKKLGHLAPPLIPRIQPMPVAQLCQLVLLWSLAGETAVASELAYSIPLDFPWMWSRESDYQDEETIASLALLRQAIGYEEMQIEGGDPYFQALAQHLQHLEPSNHPVRPLDWSLLETEGLQCALTFSGEGTSLGAILSEETEIRAFGPSAHPLSDSSLFGIRPIAQHGNRWASPIGDPEVWFDTKATVTQNQLLFEHSFFGLRPNCKMNFSFYVKADQARVGHEIIKPNTLARYLGECQPVVLGDQFQIESLNAGKMEIIPLAGSGAFWNCDYLVSFEIHPIIAKFSFLIST